MCVHLISVDINEKLQLFELWDNISINCMDVISKQLELEIILLDLFFFTDEETGLRKLRSEPKLSF